MSKLYNNSKRPSIKKVANEEDGGNENEEDPCAKPPSDTAPAPSFLKTPGNDPRFQQQNQTLRCFVMYCDFHQCQTLLGEGAEACTWFKEVYNSICPMEWVERWDTWRTEGRLSWYKTADFAQGPYGKHH